jgi:beta-lactamase regulating signal transducer with metallopeptidase domain
MVERLPKGTRLAMIELTSGWLPRNELQALGWTLLHFCWQGVAIALLYAIADRLTARASPATRYFVALAAMILMTVAVGVTFLSEMQTLPHTSAISEDMGNRTVIQYRLAKQFPHAVLPAMETHHSWIASYAEPLLPWIDALWILGVLLLATRAVGGWWQLQRMRYRAQSVIPQSIRKSFRHSCELLQVGREVSLRASREVISPIAMGVWRTTVILPVSSLMHLSTEELEAVFAHELAHIRRWDYACNLLQIAVESALFFHPVVWWVSRDLRNRREICCDEIAVEKCADPLVYVGALLRLEEQRAVELRLAVALKGRGGSLVERVKRILGESNDMESRMTSGVRMAVTAAIFLGLAFGPKMKDAVAAPIAQFTNPAAAQITPALPHLPSQTMTVKAQLSTQPATAVEKQITTIPVRDQEPVQIAENVQLEPQAEEKTSSPKGAAYIDGMRAAGYPLDLNKDLDTLISLRSLGVTPEYAQAMANLGWGKPSLDDLISLKALGITREYVDGLKQSGIGPKDFQEVITEKSLGITPEYAAQMKRLGFADLDVPALVSLKATGMTPEYGAWLKKEFPQATLDELKQAAVFHLDEKFLNAAKAHGFSGTDLDKLLRLKISGLLDE